MEQDFQPNKLPEEIRAAAARGWHLLPIRTHDKTPLLKKWPQFATSDTSQLEAWAEHFPACNWGTATGQVSRIFVLDVDGQPGKAALKTFHEQGFELPETLTVITGRGRHLYFRWPQGIDLRDSAGMLAKGLDIRANGGCAVIPPSFHFNGKQYVYVDATAPIAVPPSWLLAKLSKPASAQKLTTMQPDGAISEGKRNDALTSLAGAMRRRGMSLATIEAAMLEENRRRCQPPLPEAEVRKIAASITRYAPAQSRIWTASRPMLICLSDVEAKPVDWLWEPYLPMGMLSLLSGDPGSGKTFLSLAISASLSNGLTPYTLQACEPVNTLYLSLENSAEHVVRPRFDLLKGNCNRFQLLQGSISGENQPNGIISLSDTALLEQAIVATKAGLLIVDPIQSYLGADVDFHRCNETRPVLDGLGYLASKHNCCVLLLRHLSKSSGGRAIHRGLGSIDLTGSARTELLAGTAPDDPNRRALVQIKNNLGPYGDSLGYSIDEKGFSWTGKSELTSSDLLASNFETETRSDIACAVDYLEAELASGPRFQKELVERSEFPERTLQRAARRIAVKKDRDGERGPWRWSLR